MSFACPHFEWETDHCLALRTLCVPGRPGCVLRHNSVFYGPVEERLRELEKPSVSKPPEPGPDRSRPPRRPRRA
jgi:hypothetical protein